MAANRVTIEGPCRVLRLKRLVRKFLEEVLSLQLVGEGLVLVGSPARRQVSFRAAVGLRFRVGVFLNP